MMIKSRKELFSDLFCRHNAVCCLFSVTALANRFGSIPTDYEELTFRTDPVLKELKSC